MASQHTSRDALIKRLSAYWKMEAGNALLVPAIILFLSEARLSAFSLLAFAPMIGLLIIGAIYWRAKLRQISEGAPTEHVILMLARWQWPMLVLTMLAILAMLLLWLEPTLAKGRADQWAATVAAILAALEYVNYYHRQLQHFDHWADWKRLFRGKGFRKSQLRQDMDRINRLQAST